MAILAECLVCHRKQAVKNQNCVCGEDLVKAKRKQKIRYWINYRLPNGKQRREAVEFFIEEAGAAEGKREAQKYVNPPNSRRQTLLGSKIPQDFANNK